MKAPAIGRKLLKYVSMVLLKTTPIKAVGIVPTMIRGISLPFSDLKSPFTSAARMVLMLFGKREV
jgi:hypothetical protein